VGLQRLSDKKTRKLSMGTGIVFTKAGVHSDGNIAECVTSDDKHLLVDRHTFRIVGEVEYHWTSCGSK
jgi:hypothetical protein